MTREMEQVLVKVENARLPWFLSEEMPSASFVYDLGDGNSLSLRLEGKEVKKILMNKIAEEGLESLKNDDPFARQVCLKGCDCEKNIQ